ncbi:serine hydrolase domain-containing protein [Amorphus coralli]|uniref:serine hydrolase domain-containing protein n=1 Tax=Amorphus coralli TaxID=340680 RepID=UPI00036B5C22|nr:serine hydrolase [Amorphus coralli]
MAAFPVRAFIRWLLIGFLLVGAGAFAAAAWQLPPMLRIGSAYVAKTVCSGMYVSGLDFDRVWDEDVLGRQNPLLNLFRVTVDDPVRRITASPFGLGAFSNTAVHREGLGCALAIGITPAELAAERAATAGSLADPNAAWPDGSQVSGETPAVLSAAIDKAFQEPSGDNAGNLRTRAVVIVRDGQIVAERYAEGITETTPLTGWSMAKPVTAALAGIAMTDSDLALDLDHLLPQWNSDADPRSRIPFSALLSMTDGLAYNENYGTVTDTTTMLYDSGNAVDFLAAMDLEDDPGTRWAYSSGATVLAMGAMRASLPVASWLDFPRRALFDPIGMRTAVFETDPSGTFMGSSWVHASARDWARFGLLLLEKGLWNGEQVLPVGWVDTMMEPVAASGGRFTVGNLWPQRGGSLPSDTLWMRGHDGQSVAIVPSLDLVVVRLGMTNPQGLYDREGLLADVIAALPEGGPASAD